MVSYLGVPTCGDACDIQDGHPEAAAAFTGNIPHDFIPFMAPHQADKHGSHEEEPRHHEQPKTEL